jgi:succinate-semialdehyde dehydrogenase/glutarate-semialdehyde dehydrogenase
MTAQVINVPDSVPNPNIDATSAVLAKIPTGLLIGSEFVKGSNGTFDVTDPANGEILIKVANAGIPDLEKALALAVTAQEKWAKTAPRIRGEVLRKTFELMIEQTDELALIMSLENGKTLVDAKAEVIYAAEFFRWFSEEAVRIDGSLRNAPSGANRILTYKQPIGVAFLITPWNFPAAMFTRKIGAALAAGCAAILKPASETPLTALAIGKIMLQAGALPGTLAILQTDQAGVLTEAAINDHRIAKLSFTGSTGVGKMLLKKAADRVLNCSMELGGNAPFIVLDDADIDAAIDGAMIAKMRNGGQACTAANRFFVQEKVHDEFVTKLATRMGALKIGHGSNSDTTLAPLINRKAVDSVSELVADAITKGATQIIGGTTSIGPGCYFPATVLGNVASDSRIIQEEVFGPVAAIVKVKDEEEALFISNKSEYGLAGYVYTKDLARGLRVSERLQVGMVGLNRGLVSDPSAPFGGVKQSGLGREGGYEGIEEYLEIKYVATNDF